MQQNKPIIIYGTPTCSDCIRSKSWFDDHNIPYTEINVAEDEEQNEYITKLNNGIRKIPTIVFPDGSFLVEPVNPALEKHIKDLGLLSVA